MLNLNFYSAVKSETDYTEKSISGAKYIRQS